MPSNEEKILVLLRFCNELAHRYQRVKEKQAATRRKVAQLVPQVMNALNEDIDETQKQAVAHALATDWTKALELLRDLPGHRRSIGVPMGQTKAASSRRRPFGASVVDYDETEAGRIFREILLSGSASIR